jgi:hypothetical protein
MQPAPLFGFCRLINRPSDSIENGQVLCQLSDQQLVNDSGKLSWLAGDSHHNRLDTTHKVASIDKVRVACLQTGKGNPYDRDTEAVTGQGAFAEILRSPPPLLPAPGGRDQYSSSVEHEFPLLSFGL